jgi:organic radical activating enzyme
MLKVNEIFYSIQGEGYHTGMPAIFVRLSGCNRKCVFCDTRHDFGEELSLETILERIRAISDRCRNIIITGGEPTLQEYPLYSLTQLLSELGYVIHLETNGENNIITQYFDWITVSPKEHISNLEIDRADEIKVVYWGQNVDEWLNFPVRHRYLQPCDDKNKEFNVLQTIDKVKEEPKWRLSLQIQKMLKIQ